MDDKDVQKLIEKGDVFIGKIIKDNDGKYDLNGIFLNKWGQIFTPIVYVTGLGVVTYGLTKLNMKIMSKIYDKMDERKMRKQTKKINELKAIAFDNIVDEFNQLKEEHDKEIQFQQKCSEEFQSIGKHNKESE